MNDRSAVQQNVSRADGKPNILLSVMKKGSVSTLDIARRSRAKCCHVKSGGAAGMKITELFDQWLFALQSKASTRRGSSRPVSAHS
jgi:multidrug efflux pump subunit AcrB